MYIKTIHVEYTRKLNLGNYESQVIGASAWADLDEEENAQDSMDELYNFIRGNVRARCIEFMAKAKNLKVIHITSGDTVSAYPVLPDAKPPDEADKKATAPTDYEPQDDGFGNIA